MSEEVKHAQLPFRKVEHNWSDTSIYDADNNVVAVLSIRDLCDDEDDQERLEPIMGANAEFIVRACNSHYELVEALEGILHDDSPHVSLDEQRQRWEERMDAAKAALAKAKGGQGE